VTRASKPVALLAASLGLVSSLACQALLPPRPYDPFELGTPLAVDAPAVAARLASLAENTRSHTSLVAAAKLSLAGPDVNLNRPQRLAARRPASLRVEILGLFGQVAAILVTDGQTYQLWDASSAETTSGEVTPYLLWNVAQVDLSPDEAVRLLLGDPTSGRDLDLVAAVALPGGVIALSLREPDGEGSRTVEFDPEGRVTRALRYDPDGTLVWDAAFGDYRDVGQYVLAHDLQIEFPSFDARASFRLDRAELNRPLPDGAFTLPGKESASAR